MAKCAVCEKAAHFGIKVSHFHIEESNKMWKSNIKESKGKRKRNTKEDVRMYFLFTVRCR